MHEEATIGRIDMHRPHTMCEEAAAGAATDDYHGGAHVGVSSRRRLWGEARHPDNELMSSISLHSVRRCWHDFRDKDPNSEQQGC